MAQEPVNYEAVLVDLRAKRASLDAAIAAIEQLQSVGNMSGETAGATKQIDGGSIPDDAFFGLSIVEAAKKYLSIVRRKQSVGEIADALERGGLLHTSHNFAATVSTMLRRANDPDMAKVGRGDWGLASWYGNRRPKQEPVVKKARSASRSAKRSRKERKGSHAAPTEKAEKPTTQAGDAGGGTTLMDHVETVLRQRGQPMDVGELVDKVSERANRLIARATLVGMLAEKVRKGQRFTRPAPSTYALAG